MDASTSAISARPWLLDTWYAAAWSSEIGHEPLGRTLLDQPVVLFRRENGTPAAIGGRCPHRFAPLAMGKRVGDGIECPYHGLRFDATGACVHNPHGQTIPKAARVPEFRVEERWGLLWLWPGDSARADVASIPDLSHLERQDLGHVTGTMGVQAHYELYVDNLMDLTHAQFVHGDRLMSNNFEAARQEVVQEGLRIVNRIAIADSDVPVTYRPYLPQEVQRVDYWMDSFWSAPSIVTNWVGVTLPGRPREEGVFSFGVHIATPATPGSSHYFYANSRNRAIGDPAADAKMREWHRVGFGEQDKPIIEAVARMMGPEVDPLAMHAVLLPTDAAAVRVRRTLAALKRAEAELAATGRA